MATQITSNLKKHFDYQNINIKNILNEFTKPIYLNIFFRNLDFLTLKSDLIIFNNNKWYQQPNLFCKDYYDEPYVSPVILLINNIGSFLDFKPTNFINELIMCPKYNHIHDVLYLPTL